MSTYFQAVNDGNIVQLNDEYTVHSIVRDGMIKANVNKNEMYGFYLHEDEEYAAFKINKGKLLITPMLRYQGQKIYYVTSTTDEPIYYRVYSSEFNRSESNSHAGLRLYNKDGCLIFDSGHKLERMLGTYMNVYDRTANYKDGLDDTEALCVGHVYSNYGMERYGVIDNYLIGRPKGCKPWSKVIDTDTYVASFATPWCPRYVCEYSFYACAYVFENGTLSTETKMTQYWTTGTRKILYGGGDINQILTWVNDFMVEGITSLMYMFNLVK